MSTIILLILSYVAFYGAALAQDDTDEDRLPRMNLRLKTL